ncbi:response regulator [Desulfovibrio litoralis]|uniref:Sensory/regulatory protein RpfC n=1 Tax=Desulfovibrio litoralis DSM 11393 TaxID=1121455 RepID=A0A1M7SLD8_9BACT|nr:response regulator [Desulfovibrio litoralis]SHN59270.1 Signal transduction histidine kinase [Desulfovibrio litoralis DSM 11393]
MNTVGFKSVSKNHNKAVLKFIFWLILLWTFLVLLSLWSSLSRAERQSEEDARIQARTIFEKDSSLITWNVAVGGIYAPIGEEIRPNPYLAPYGREVETPTGEILTKINASLMVRLIYEMSALESGVVARLASNNPLRPLNMSDEWEFEALNLLEKKQVNEISSIETINNSPYMRLIRPLILDKNCLTCHTQPQNTLGAIHGGISVLVPMEPFTQIAQETYFQMILSHLALWLIVVILIFWGGNYLNTNMNAKEKAEQDLKNLACELEDRVKERTKELALKQSQLVAFMNNSDAGIFLKNKVGEYVLCNAYYAALLGRTTKEIKACVDTMLMPSELSNKIKTAENAACKDLTAVEISGHFDLNDKSEIFVAHIFPIINEKGLIDGVGGIIMNDTERIASEEVLKNAKAVAESASRSKSDFLANMSHEIRTPLNGVIGMADLLLQTKLNQEQASMAATIKNSGDSLLVVLNDILDFSKIEAGKMSIDSEPFSLRDMIFGAVKAIAPIAYKKNLELIVDINSNIPDHLDGDSNRIRQVVTNFLSNAIKFTDSGEVSLSVELVNLQANKVSLKIKVQDTGIGIPFEKQKNIFDSFEQGDSSTTRKYGGTGLGLTISHRLTVLMGGEISLESEQGKGSTFSVSLELPFLVDSSLSKIGMSTVQFKGLKALIVDDNATNRRIYSEYLSSWNFSVQDSVSVDDAMHHLKLGLNSHRAFDIVLLDVHMPDKDGFYMLELMRSNPDFQDVPVILLSSANVFLDSDELKSYDVLLSKPIRPEELMLAMGKALGLCSNELCIDSNASYIDKDVTARIQLNILLAEDMEMNQLVISKMLSTLGHNYTIVENGQKVLEALEKATYDLVMMDIQMPIMDGIRATQLIREKEKNNNSGQYTPIIALTANALKGDREKYLAIGMDNYVSKPIQLEALSKSLNDIMARFISAKLNNYTVNSGVVSIIGTTNSEPLNSQNSDFLDNKIDSGNVAALADLKENQKEEHKRENIPIEGISDSIDKAVVSNAFGGNNELIAATMDVYFRDAPIQLNGILEAINEGNNELLVSSAHSLKGISSYYSRGAVYQTCLKIEKYGRDKMLPDAKEELTSEYYYLSKNMEALILSMKNFFKE